MINRIEELIALSYDQVPHERDWDSFTSEFNKEKFAQLIINECVSVCLEQRDPMTLNYKPSVRTAEAIRQHFGID